MPDDLESFRAFWNSVQAIDDKVKFEKEEFLSLFNKIEQTKQNMLSITKREFIYLFQNAMRAMKKNDEYYNSLKVFSLLCGKEP